MRTLSYKPLIVWLLLNISIFSGCATVKPTATVIDYETRKPVEGAVAIAIWRGHLKDCTLPQSLEGGCWGVTKIVETVSDKDGNIFIDGFWNWGQVEKPRLTVYKFGYVCWDQKQVFSMKGPRPMRIDFNKDNRTVWLEKWPEGFSSNEHSSFIRNVTNGDYYKTQKQLFVKERWPQKNMH